MPRSPHLCPADRLSPDDGGVRKLFKGLEVKRGWATEEELGQIAARSGVIPSIAANDALRLTGCCLQRLYINSGQHSCKSSGWCMQVSRLGGRICIAPWVGHAGPIWCQAEPPLHQIDLLPHFSARHAPVSEMVHSADASRSIT
jgi:hypothetical protein